MSSNNNLLEKGKTALEHLPEAYLPVIVRWLELLSDEESELEFEDFLLLISGKLKEMTVGLEDAQDIDDWQAYLNEI